MSLVSLELDALMKHMRDIRNTSDYRGTLDYIRTDLGLDRKKSDSEIEALLIYATMDCFKGSLDADIVLSAFGLLKGYDNQHSPDEANDGNALITVRRKKFIRESSYVADRYGPYSKRKVHYNSYNELVAAGEAAVDDVIKSLGSEDGLLINKVAKKLYENAKNILSYLEESAKYLVLDEERHIIGVELQDIVHKNRDEVISNENNNTTAKKISTSEISTNEHDSVTEQNEPRSDNLLTIFDTIFRYIVGIAIVVIAICMVINMTAKDSSPSEDPTQQNIKVEVIIQGENITVNSEDSSTQIYDTLLELLD